MSMNTTTFHSHFVLKLNNDFCWGKLLRILCEMITFNMGTNRRRDGREIEIQARLILLLVQSKIHDGSATEREREEREKERERDVRNDVCASWIPVCFDDSN
jgi:hypothetical protein